MSHDLLGEIAAQREAAKYEAAAQRPAFTELTKGFLQRAGAATYELAPASPSTPPQGRNDGVSARAGILILSNGTWHETYAEEDHSEARTEEIPDPLGKFFTPVGETVGCMYGYSAQTSELRHARDRLAKQGSGTTTNIVMSLQHYNSPAVTAIGVRMEDVNDPLRLASHYLLGVLDLPRKA